MNQEDLTSFVIAGLVAVFFVSLPYNILLGGHYPYNLQEYAIAVICVVAAIILGIILVVSIWT